MGDGAAAYHAESYDRRVWQRATWLGVGVCKHPNDLMTYQEVLYAVRPALVLETGTYAGGSAYFFATVMDLLGAGAVWTVDPYDHPPRPAHPRVTYRLGSSTDPAVVAEARSLAASCGGPVMVVLDSDHSEGHVRRELSLYAPLVTPGSYLVCEDTNVNGNPVYPGHGPGPMEAVRGFLGSPEGRNFAPDPACEKYLMTYFPGGWLRRAA